MQSIESLLAFAKDELREISEIPFKEGQILLEHATSLSKVEIYTHPEKEIESEPFLSYVKRRKEGEPVEYITQKVSFYGEDFFIQKGALIPRPETEILVEKVIALIENIQNPCLVDVGTGSGVIAVMIAKMRPDATIFAIDISDEALHIAMINAHKMGVSDQITFLKGDLLHGFEHDVDGVISNPPYIAEGTVLEKPLSYEPSCALFGGILGYEPYEELIAQVSQKRISFLACEMGYDQKEVLSRIFERTRQYDVQFYQDYSGLDRGFIATTQG